ncbi:hypothetical protein BDF19DRAFT_425024 [Syncephalis fuscata]|nr:hypothetical protein BDF19DRAFT_425024 [Syncephalis fuscata]
MNSPAINKRRLRVNSHDYTKLPRLPSLSSSTRFVFIDWIHRCYCRIKCRVLPFIVYCLPRSWLNRSWFIAWTASSTICLQCRPRWPAIWPSVSTLPHRGGVLVYDAQAIKALWQGGFFGKGVISRGEPLAITQKEGASVSDKRAVTSGETVNAKYNIATPTTNVATTAATTTQRTKRRRKTKVPAQSLISVDQQIILLQTMLLFDSKSYSYDLNRPANEPLWLSPEEVFFLSWHVGCLQIIDEVTQQPLDLWTLWQRCCAVYKPRFLGQSMVDLKLQDITEDRPFIYRYAVYQYLRNKGWVVRDGIKYGADYVIYERGPIFDHSIAAVLICPILLIPNTKNDDSDMRDLSSKQTRQVSLDWSNLLGLIRVCSQVRKALRICYVYVPVTNKGLKEQGPAFIQSYRIEETVIKRWVPERNRA